MSFRSILFPDATNVAGGTRAPAAGALHDLALDQVIEAVIRGREQYDLGPLFRAPLRDVDCVHYRHEVMRDLEDPANLQHVRDFAEGMQSMRKQLEQANALRNRQQKERWLLDATATYCRAVVAFSRSLDGVEEKIVEFVACLYPEVFSALDEFSGKYEGWIDQAVARFDREVQFYIAYIEYIRPLKRAGLAFSYPRLSSVDKSEQARDTFDLALASRLVAGGASVVVNDFDLSSNERVLLVSGPNQGAKTTFARTFGQLHYLASIGCPVPGRETRLLLCDGVLTHFEREENFEMQRGKLEDDLIRIRDILATATPETVVILNELFNSTTADDALALSEKVMQRVVRLDLLRVWVTFLDEVVSMSDTAVSMVSSVAPDNPAERTYRIERRPSDGLAHAAAIARKYG